jgi:diaminohydroxyphosphoribosylaminopyrimidine deaminase/5-amino-6-(5-phosphoribosylamino)uracil reductase
VTSPDPASIHDSFSALDHVHMARALKLAARGMFTSQPNPRVGCVLAHGEHVVGEGWHERAGEPHAEVHALRQAGAAARGATAYVTLEPCAHHGRTPPCVEALIAAGVARVVVACGDPNPKVAGRGLARLREAGVVVEQGLLRAPARELNRGFFSRLERGRPWLRVKLALSLDGRTALADGTSKWITGAAARADVQRWRAQSSALLTGSGTLRADDPRLTVRLDPGIGFTPPLRVVLDRNLQTPPTARVLDAAAPTLLVHAANATRPAHLAGVDCVPVAVRDDRLDLDAVLRLLAAREINELQVEAGPTLCGALAAAGLVDEWLLYLAPRLLGDRARPLLFLPPITALAEAPSLQLLEQRAIGSDWRLWLRG